MGLIVLYIRPQNDLTDFRCFFFFLPLVVFALSNKFSLVLIKMQRGFSVAKRSKNPERGKKIYTSRVTKPLTFDSPFPAWGEKDSTRILFVSLSSQFCPPILKSFHLCSWEKCQFGSNVQIMRVEEERKKDLENLM